jgi:hypothetical protein
MDGSSRLFRSANGQVLVADQSVERRAEGTLSIYAEFRAEYHELKP